MLCEEGKNLISLKETAEKELNIIKAKMGLPTEPLNFTIPDSKFSNEYIEKWRKTENARLAYNTHLESCMACSLNSRKEGNLT